MADMRFDGRVAIVTGAGGGLGKAYATLLAARGAKVLVNDLGGDFVGNGRDAGYAAAAADAIRAVGGEVQANTDSVATAEGAAAIFAAALERWGQVDIIINNAGIVSAHDTLDTVTDAQWTQDMAVSAGGTFYMCRAAWRHMVDRGYGRIVNISSPSWFGLNSAVPYPAAKGAIWAITRNLAAAGRASNVKVNCVMPGAASRMSAVLGPEIMALFEREMPVRAVAPVVAMLAHEEVPVNGEMFTAAAGGFARVFVGVTPGYRAHDHDWTIEDVRSHLDQAMATDGFTVPADTYDETALYGVGIPWDSFRQYVQ